MDLSVKEEKIAGIPTEDPLAALNFCRALAALMQTAPLGQDAIARRPELEHKASIGNEGGTGAPVVAALQAQTSDPYIASLTTEISVVIPVFNEEENLPILYHRLTAVLDNQGLSYEIIFVDDGSKDQSPAILENLVGQDNRVRLVQLGRNFGHQVAISAGLNYAQGKAVIVMDADLQDPPEVLPEFIEKWREGYDVVYAVRQNRQENWLKRLAYASFYRLLRHIAKVDIPLDAGDFSIMDRQVVSLLRAMPERNRFVRGIRSWVGLRQCGLPYSRQARQAGRAKFTASHLIILALDGFISFSQAPLRLASLLGLVISLASFFMVVVYLSQKIMAGHTTYPSSGFTTLIISIFFLGGIQLITIGVMGEYIGRIFEEVKQRPLYVVRRVKGF